MVREGVSCANRLYAVWWLDVSAVKIKLEDVKEMVKRILMCLLFSLAAFGQSQHSVVITWTASTDAVANPTLIYNVYRAPVSCSNPTPQFVKVGSASSSITTFTDNAVPLGNFCYAVTSLVNGVESVNSNTAVAVVLPAPPTGLLVQKVN